MQWIPLSEKWPEVLGEDILICYEYNDKLIVEIGYLCGDKLIKGASERYPFVLHWMPLPAPPEEFKNQKSSIASYINLLPELEKWEKISDAMIQGKEKRKEQGYPMGARKGELYEIGFEDAIKWVLEKK